MTEDNKKSPEDGSDDESSLGVEYLFDTLYILSRPAEEQLLLNGPGCLSCDQFDHFDSGYRYMEENGYGGSTEAERLERQRCLKVIDSLINSMHNSEWNDPDAEWTLHRFEEEVLNRPFWCELRVLAAEALKAFGREHMFVPYGESSVDPISDLAARPITRFLECVQDRIGKCGRYGHDFG
jgi:hypothetical protein